MSEEAASETADVRSVDVPELREVILAHARVREIERIRGEAGMALAVATFEASQIASITLIARTVGVSRQRVQDLIDKGRVAAGHTKRRKKGEHR